MFSSAAGLIVIKKRGKKGDQRSPSPGDPHARFHWFHIHQILLLRKSAETLLEAREGGGGSPGFVAAWSRPDSPSPLCDSAFGSIAATNDPLPGWNGPSGDVRAVKQVSIVAAPRAPASTGEEVEVMGGWGCPRAWAPRGPGPAALLVPAEPRRVCVQARMRSATTVQNAPKKINLKLPKD